MDTSSIEPGALTTRADMQRMFGGGIQEGIISTPSSILIYVDHHSGGKYGYEDGWLEEEDGLGPVFEYTGRGAVGHQTFLGLAGSRNKAILQHVANKKSLRIFIAQGKIPNSNSSAKQQRYVGEFELDSEQPYTIREAVDKNHEPRRIIVFRMRPKGSYQRLADDTISRAPQTSIERVSATIANTKIVEPKRKRAVESRRAAQPSVIADLRQSQLREKYLSELEKSGHEVFTLQIKISGTTKVFKTDLYDATDHVLHSIRGDSSREEVRIAIGQLKDCVRHVKPSNPRLRVLLPEKPIDDLLDLLHHEGIDVIFPGNAGYVKASAR
ncbi:hypothetical protein ACIQNG_07030 [Streptomyces sp. NPDC091377]|uniref:hypothetical protein n=1 Tax=Streptomyces sp. NPDC091377 TaxID=3365995 RepID=UPI00381E0D63